MRRIVSVWLPDWPITVWSKAARPKPPPDGESLGAPSPAPFALVDRTARGLILSAVNAPARALGLRRGQTHADACAILPGLGSAPADAERDRAALRRLALWAERFSPCVAVDQDEPGQEGLLLDMTGGAHLFGGESALLAEIERRLQAASIPARAAIADTPGAAWALARFARAPIAEAGAARAALADLPMEALRLEEASLRLLRRFGLKRIGDLYGLPRAGLARRFHGGQGMALVRRFDQALGAEPEPLTPVRPAPLYRTWQVFAEPLIDMQGVAHVLPALVEALAAQLTRDGLGARRLALTAFRTDGRATSLEAGLSAPAADPAHLLRLLNERGLDRLDLGFGADALMLEAGKAEPARVRQTDLAGNEVRGGAQALTGLIDRIEAKLGDGAVARPMLRDSFIPERSEAWIGVGEPAPPAFAHEPGAMRPRPLFLLDPPEPIETLAELPDSAPTRFVWRRVARKVARAEGPERLSPEWWRPPAGAHPERTRDYYRVEDEDGRRYWLFREGLYDREMADRPPSWWMQGVFA